MHIPGSVLITPPTIISGAIITIPGRGGRIPLPRREYGLPAHFLLYTVKPRPVVKTPPQPTRDYSKHHVTPTAKSRPIQTKSPWVSKHLIKHPPPSSLTAEPNLRAPVRPSIVPGQATPLHTTRQVPSGPNQPTRSHRTQTHPPSGATTRCNNTRFFPPLSVFPSPRLLVSSLGPAKCRCRAPFFLRTQKGMVGTMWLLFRVVVNRGTG